MCTLSKFDDVIAFPSFDTGHMYDTYVKRVVHMRGKLYYKYAKRQLTEFEMQSLEDRWVKFQGIRVQDRYVNSSL